MNIFSTFRQTAYVYHQRQAPDTWSGNGKSQDFNAFGVWKPRNESDIPTAFVSEVGMPTLNVKVSEKFINRKQPGQMIGDTVTVPAYGGHLYRVTGVTTAKNFREGTVSHYRLTLEEVAE